MIKLEQTNVEGWEAAIRGMRNPLNSWEKSDSECLYHMVENWKAGEDSELDKKYNSLLDDWGLNLKIGSNDLGLMTRLVKAGNDHGKFMRFITVTCDITAPLYWWKEFDTYKVGTVANSCSTMHTIHKKKFTMDDFSTERLFGRYNNGLICSNSPLGNFRNIVGILNSYRDIYINGGHVDNYNGTMTYYQPKSKEVLWQMIQLLPSSYNQKRTVQLNYAVLRDMYFARRNNELDEWSVGFMEWIKSLPYSELITGVDE